VFQKIAGLTVGAVFVSRWGRSIRQHLADAGPKADWPRLRAAIVAHVYYPELLGDILACQDLLPAGTPLHITVPPERSHLVREALGRREHVVVHEYENRGRDIAPFLSLLSSGALDGYDAVLKLHTKRSPHLLDGEIRRRLLLDRLCGDWNALCRALAAFERPSTAIVGWRQCWRATPSYWMANEARVQDLAIRMDVAAEAFRLGFFEGSMFWFRPASLAALRELDLEPEDFEPEEHQLDGTLHHAVERCFTIAAWARGYSVLDLKGNAL
jgi:rhamnosyltransferase